MGVQRLEELIGVHKDVLKEIEFRNEKLVIDGSSLFYKLYFDSRLDQIHGGDYIGFRNINRKFFKKLSDCGIKPYVLMDGGSVNDIKFNTQLERFRDKIIRAGNIANVEPGVLPPLVKDVFIKVLLELKVPFAQCLGEADPEIVSLANSWSCPVLTHDTDFYIYELSAGFLPLSHFKWEENPNQIQAKKYRVENLSELYEMDPSLLPVFASIAGNDFSRLNDQEKFAPMKSGPPLSKDALKIKRLEAILKWLATLSQGGQIPSLESAVDSALEFTEKSNDTDLRNKLLQSARIYTQPTDSSIREFFERDILPVKPESLRVLPDWTIGPLIRGELTSFITDVLLHRRMVLSPQVEDPGRASGHLAARPIRQYLYGLLLNGPGTVKEYDREGEQPRETDVVPENVQLTLEELDTAEEKDRLLVLMNALGIPWPNAIAILGTLPEHLRLPVCALHFWRNHSDPKPSEHHVISLLLGAVYGEQCRQMSAFLLLEGEVVERMRDITRKIQDEGEFLRTMKEIKEKELPRDLEVAHLFSQWQSCLKESLHLNQLLRFPLRAPECTWLYCGPLVHHLVADLSAGTYTSYTTLLQNDPVADGLFQLLLRAAENLQEEADSWTKVETNRSKKRKAKGRSGKMDDQIVGGAKIKKLGSEGRK